MRASPRSKWTGLPPTAAPSNQATCSWPWRAARTMECTSSPPRLPVALHRSLDALAGEGITHLAIEASSHGLHQHRLDGVRVAAAGFTNLSRDHLDYHPTLEDYLAAKLRLFTELVQPRGVAVINVDHEHAEAVVAAAKQRRLRLLTVGRGGEGIRLVESSIVAFAQVITARHAGTNHTFRL